MKRYSALRGNWRGLSLLAPFALFSLSTPASAAPQGAYAPKWGVHIDTEGWLGNKRNLGEGDLFLPLLQGSRTLLFTDLRGRFDNHSSREGNFGLGVRHMLDSGWNLGVYGYWDHRRSPYAHYFNQITLGAEALGRNWDLRANGYIPTGTRSYSVNSLNSAMISGSSIIFSDGVDKSLGGYDGEVGWRVPVFSVDGSKQLRLYLGGYRFTASSTPTIAGPRARLEFTLYQVPHLWQGSRLALGAEVQHDGPRGTQSFVNLRLRIPLGSTAGQENRLDWQERRMTAPIVRDVDVVTEAGAYGPQEIATETANGSAITVLSSTTTTGANLPTAVANAGANSTVILSGTFNTTATTTLQSGQTVIGGGSLTVKAPSGRTATLILSNATVAGAVANAATLAMASNSTLTHLTVSNTVSGSNVSIAVDVGSGVTGATISDSALTADQTGTTNAIGLRALAGSSLTASGNTITASGNNTNIAVLLSSDAVTFAGNTIGVTGGITNRTVQASGATIASGSTGNAYSSGNIGSCYNGGGNTGSISFTDGTTCP